LSAQAPPKRIRQHTSCYNSLMIKVYFACSIRGGGDTSLYQSIVDAIKQAGGDVLSEVFVHDAINYGGSPLPADQIYERDTQMIHDSDVMIAEVTNPSLGVGYELAYAEKLHRPILCLFNTTSANKLSAMVAGNNYNTIEYTHPDEITDTVRTFMNDRVSLSQNS
jgi:nucleoside 2-deoxyribosyltransferase